MADNVNITPGSGVKVAADEVSYSGDIAQLQLTRPVYSTGSEGSKTVVLQSVGAGATDGGTQRVTAASDDPVAVAVGLMTKGAANLVTNQVSVDTTGGGVVIAAFRATRRSVTVVNHGTTAVYLGTGTVSAVNGVLLPGVIGASYTFCVTAAIKAIVATGSQTVSYAEEYD